MKPTTLLSSLFIPILFFVFHPPCLAFNVQNRWESNEVYFHIVEDAEPNIKDKSEISAILNAFKRWGNVDCTALTLSVQGKDGSEFVPKEDAKVLRDGYNMVFWETDETKWPFGSDVLAYTSILTDPDKPQYIADADIVFNGQVSWSTHEPNSPSQGYDIETILVRQVGFFIGLNESSSYESVMSYLIRGYQGEQYRDLQPDDRSAVCFLYPTQLKGDLHAQCSEDQPCNEAFLCTKYATVSICTLPCEQAEKTSSCPDGYSCQMQNDADEYVCLPKQIESDLCDPCSSGYLCNSGVCLQSYQNFYPFCTRVCTTEKPESCPQDYFCYQEPNAFAGVCLPKNGVCQVGYGGLHEDCIDVSGSGYTCNPRFTCVIWDNAENIRYCQIPCLTNTECPSGYECLDIPNFQANQTKACYKIADDNEPCVPETCKKSSICVIENNIYDAVCRRECTESSSKCAQGTTCTKLADKEQSICIPIKGNRALGDNCQKNDDCISGFCFSLSESVGQTAHGSKCTRPCGIADDQKCPGEDLFECRTFQTSVSSENHWCWPRTDIQVCECDLPENGGTHACDPNCACDPECVEGCACDISASCDQDCSCDSDCKDLVPKGCSCSSVTIHDESSFSQQETIFDLFILILLLFLGNTKMRFSTQ